ncbi:MAG: hypothetical protein LAT64_12665 [Phycisphaerales bacterium]|nr:hypothetical protein [Planctomycetota bacterium]MCH8509606.1 hypothetical protein [Phycisphaerales bacterium]
MWRFGLVLAAVLLATGCARVPRVTVQNDLQESVIAHVSMPPLLKLQLAPPHYPRAFDKTLGPGEVWRSSRAKRAEKAERDRSMAGGGLRIRLRTWGAEPRVYVVHTREDAVIRIEPDPEEHDRVMASDPKGEPISVVRSPPRE